MARFRAIVYRSRGVGRGWRWMIVARNGNKVANSGEAYTKRSHAIRMADAAGVGFGVERVEVLAGRWRKP